MAELKVKITGDSSDFSAVASGAVKTAKTTQAQIAAAAKERQATQERWLKREREMNGLTARERVQQTAMRGRLEQNARDVQARAIRRERDETRALLRDKLAVAAVNQKSPQFVAGAIRGGNAARPSLQKPGAGFDGVGSALAGAFTALTAAATMAGAAILNYAGRVQDASDQTGISAEKLQRWGLAARQSGNDIGTLTTAASRMAVNIRAALADPAGETAKAFQAMGVSLEQLKTQSLEETFEQIAEHVKRSKVDAQMLAAVTKTLGRGAAHLIPTFKQGIGEGRSGNSSKTIGDLDDMGDAATRFWDRWRVIGGNAIAKLRPLMGLLEPGGYLPEKKGLSAEERDAIAKNAEPEITPEQAAADKAALDAAGARSEEMVRAGEVNKRVAEAERNNRMAAMSDEEKLFELLQEREWLQERLSKYTHEQLNTAQGGEMRLRAAELDGQIAQLEGKDSGEKIEAEKNPFKISADSASRVGGYIGGMNPAMAGDILGKQQLTEAQKTARNTQQLVQLVRNQANQNRDGGFE